MSRLCGSTCLAFFFHFKLQMIQMSPPMVMNYVFMYTYKSQPKKAHFTFKAKIKIHDLLRLTQGYLINHSWRRRISANFRQSSRLLLCDWANGRVCEWECVCTLSNKWRMWHETSLPRQLLACVRLCNLYPYTHSHTYSHTCILTASTNSMSLSICLYFLGDWKQRCVMAFINGHQSTDWHRD